MTTIELTAGEREALASTVRRIIEPLSDAVREASDAASLQRAADEVALAAQLLGFAEGRTGELAADERVAGWLREQADRAWETARAEAQALERIRERDHGCFLVGHDMEESAEITQAWMTECYAEAGACERALEAIGEGV